MTAYVRPVVGDKYCKGRDCVSAAEEGWALNAFAKLVQSASWILARSTTAMAMRAFVKARSRPSKREREQTRMNNIL